MLKKMSIASRGQTDHSMYGISKDPPTYNVYRLLSFFATKLTYERKDDKHLRLHQRKTTNSVAPLFHFEKRRNVWGLPQLTYSGIQHYYYYYYYYYYYIPGSYIMSSEVTRLDDLMLLVCCESY